ncbi:Trimeric GatFAB AmidoTransferase(AdT) complex subunit [Thelotrema lepadinum]|nr:Trimeric GatFAB AmidoTransferase(AdT) complex subunit [Thelotrema lepadinum]
MSRELEPLVQIFDALGAENDPQDPTNLAPVTRHRRSKLRGRLQDPHGQSCYGQEQKLRVGVPIEYNLAELDDPIRSVWRETLIALASEGHSVIPVSLPTTKVSLPAYYILAPAEASSNLAKYDGVRFGNPASGWPKQPEDVLFATTRGIGMGDEVRRRILLGSFTLSASAIDNYFIKAQRIRRLVQQDFDRVFSHPNILLKDDTKLEASSIEDGVDILLTPTAPSLPPRLEDLSTKTAVDSYQDDVFTVPASLAGLPAMSIPATKIKVAGQNDDQLRHIGLQIIAQYGEEQRIFQAARILENLETGLD